jgi:hypothetical protein
MADSTPQNYGNHTVIPKSFLIVAVMFLISAILATIGLVKTGTVVGTCCIGTAVLLHALSAVFGLFIMRTYAVKLQDRIIRTEMRIRLAAVLPDELAAAAQDLTIPQLIGLRFASDEELPDLTRTVLDEKLAKADAIKKLVTNWQADHDRV